jgi:peptidoglycan/xylan/chitin deacetylase (PgdA/CDA1 family)
VSGLGRGEQAPSPKRSLRHVTRGYTVLLYHRLAGEGKAGQERIDVPPRAFDRQMRLLSRLRFSPLSQSELVEFHARRSRALPRRGVVVTIDDAFEDVVEPLLRNARLHPLLFVPTANVGGPVEWLHGERIAGWQQLLRLADAGVVLGAHTRTHVDLPAADNATAELEVNGARDDLRDRTGASPVAFAYPHGRFGEREREFVEAAGYALAFTTRPGRNDAASDPLALRRVSVKAWDSNLSFAWKLITGTQPPAYWERWLLLRAAAARRLGRARRRGRARVPAATPPDAAPPPRQRP